MNHKYCMSTRLKMATLADNKIYHVVKFQETAEAQRWLMSLAQYHHECICYTYSTEKDEQERQIPPGRQSDPDML